MKIEKLSEEGIGIALFGLGFSRELTNDISYADFFNNNKLYNRLLKIAENLSSKDGGHNKFLESIQIWLDIKAPRYWWSQFDTYRVGITKQSESTMYNICKRPLEQEDFNLPIQQGTLDYLNNLIANKEFDKVKNELPEGYLQRRIVNMNYKTFRNIYYQRKDHKLKEWREFCLTVIEKLVYPKFIDADF